MNMTEAELLSKAQALAGLTVAEIAKKHALNVPENFQHHKGWVGHLLEVALGADARSGSQPDFANLGIELKTLPINHAGSPMESTYVCHLAHDESALGERFEESSIRSKLERVLFIPMLTEKGMPPAERMITSAFLWVPSHREMAIIKADWEEAMYLIGTGQSDAVNAQFGEYLQVRPKAANSKVRVAEIDANGQHEAIIPRGFYLRPAVTRRLLKNHFGLTD